MTTQDVVTLAQAITHQRECPLLVAYWSDYASIKMEDVTALRSLLKERGVKREFM